MSSITLQYSLPSPPPAAVHQPASGFTSTSALLLAMKSSSVSTPVSTFTASASLSPPAALSWRSCAT
jgi:hypothetical protein